MIMKNTAINNANYKLADQDHINNKYGLSEQIAKQENLTVLSIENILEYDHFDEAMAKMNEALLKQKLKWIQLVHNVQSLKDIMIFNNMKDWVWTVPLSGFKKAA